VRPISLLRVSRQGLANATSRLTTLDLSIPPLGNKKKAFGSIVLSYHVTNGMHVLALHSCSTTRTFQSLHFLFFSNAKQLAPLGCLSLHPPIFHSSPTPQTHRHPQHLGIELGKHQHMPLLFAAHTTLTCHFCSPLSRAPPFAAPLDRLAILGSCCFTYSCAKIGHAFLCALKCAF